VIVFTHDDRLPEAVRRLGIDGRILEVTRAPNSQVTDRNGSDPAKRHLEDADAVARDEWLPDEIKRKAVARLCRDSLEAACRSTFFRCRLQAGDTRADVEDRWFTSPLTRERLAMALYNDPNHSLEGWLGAGNAARRRAVKVCASGLHHGVSGPVLNAVVELRTLIRDVAALHVR
jgi:hypothetical protein